MDPREIDNPIAEEDFRSQLKDDTMNKPKPYPIVIHGNPVLKQKCISREDSFFEMGGHSLLVTQLLSRIREAFEVDVPILTLFEQQTIKAQAQAIKQTLKAGKFAVKVTKAPVKRFQKNKEQLSQYVGALEEGKV